MGLVEVVAGRGMMGEVKVGPMEVAMGPMEVTGRGMMEEVKVSTAQLVITDTLERKLSIVNQVPMSAAPSAIAGAESTNPAASVSSASRSMRSRPVSAVPLPRPACRPH